MEADSTKSCLAWTKWTLNVDVIFSGIISIALPIRWWAGVEPIVYAPFQMKSSTSEDRSTFYKLFFLTLPKLYSQLCSELYNMFVPIKNYILSVFTYNPKFLFWFAFWFLYLPPSYLISFHFLFPPSFVLLVWQSFC